MQLRSTSHLFTKATPEIVLYSTSTSVTFMTSPSTSAIVTDTTTPCEKEIDRSRKLGKLIRNLINLNL
jgi:hypothetical protein